MQCNALAQPNAENIIMAKSSFKKEKLFTYPSLHGVWNATIVFNAMQNNAMTEPNDRANAMPCTRCLHAHVIPTNPIL